MLYSGTDPESYITEYASAFEDNPTLVCACGRSVKLIPYVP